MFARLALKAALVPLLRSPYSVPAGSLGTAIPAFRVGCAHARARRRRAVVRRPAARASLLDTAVSSLPRIATATARELSRRRKSLGDSSVVLG